MKRARALVAALIITVFMSLSWVGLVSAHTFKNGDSVNISQNEQIDDSLFVAGNTLSIAPTVNGDVFCAGQTVTISGTVEGDVICAAQTIHITGTVRGDVRLAAQTVTISGTVDRNATIAAQTFTLDSQGRVQGDVSATATNVVSNGAVGRDLAFITNGTVVSGSVGRDVTATTDNLALSSGARINGNIDYTSSKDLSRADGATVGGTINRSDPPEDDDRQGPTAASGFSWFIYSLISSLLVALALVLLLPRFVHAVTERALPRPWRALLVGLLASIAVPVVLILLAVTVVGIPLAILGGVLWLTVLLLSGPLFSYYLGRLVLRRSRRPIAIMLVGALILFILYYIPLLGFLALLAALWIGSGMLLLEIFNRTPRPDYSIGSASDKAATKI